MNAVVDRRGALGLGGGAVALVSLTGCGIGGPAHRAGAPDPETTAVEMGTTSFMPEAVTINAGEIVEWRNTSIAPHTVTTESERAQNHARVRVPEGAQPFHSGSIAPGEIFRHRFDVAGDYVYFCVPHEQVGMWGTVIVQPAGATAG